ncbi:putative proton transport protein motif protein [Ranid herpesvirus 3]|uniref:Putative proton transport protein motif protein n=1 Tax=Ranid herpesvirus 3 TaxID=1987509 RepID=A0A1X9T5K5_9VIRU|nr:putative proton transport protein motif protein [Ranid herpesvirus 3]ARR28980.1 putative proton transport protein motif protein [Ranid herpesvirus 3]
MFGSASNNSVSLLEDGLPSNSRLQYDEFNKLFHYPSQVFCFPDSSQNIFDVFLGGCLAEQYPNAPYLKTLRKFSFWWRKMISVPKVIYELYYKEPYRPWSPLDKLPLGMFRTMADQEWLKDLCKYYPGVSEISFIIRVEYIKAIKMLNENEFHDAYMHLIVVDSLIRVLHRMIDRYYFKRYYA